MPGQPTHTNRDIERLRLETSRRDREIPRTFYGWEKCVNRFFHCSLYRSSIDVLAAAGKFPFDSLRILDIGCGSGTWLLEFVQWGALPSMIAGIDLSEERISLAAKRLPEADIQAGDAQALPWRSASFDIVTQFTVFTSILDDSVRMRIALEMLRVLNPGGVILWYDFRFNNPRNPNVRGIRRQEIRQLFKGCDIDFRSLTLLPPLARAVVSRSWLAAELLETLPILRSHYLALIRKRRN